MRWWTRPEARVGSAADGEADRLLGGCAALILDLDGTLASVGLGRKLSLWRGLAAEGRVLVHLEHAMAATRGRRFADLDGQLAAIMAARARVEPRRARRALGEVVDRQWPQTFRGAAPPPGLARLLRAADRRGLPRAVWSDHPAISKLEAMGSAGWAVIGAGRPLGALKPLPDVGWGILAQLGASPATALMVGDRDDTDGLAAAALGCRFLHAHDVEAALGPATPGRRAPRLV